MSNASDASHVNGFKILLDELKKRTKEPRSEVVYWTYFIASVCIIGGTGVITEIFKFFYTGTVQNPDAIYFAMTTFFPALVGSSLMQIMFEPKNNRRMLAVSVLFLIGTGAVATLLISVSGKISPVSWVLAIAACLFALWVGWISNAYNLGLYDEPNPPIDAPVGGDDLDGDLQGDTDGYQL